MKKEILNIAKVKDEKSFYKKYPSEEAFMKVHGKAFKKAQMGAMINKTNTQSSFKPINLDDIYNEYDFGNNVEEPQQVPQQQSKEAGGMDMGGLMKMFGGEGGGDMSSLASSLAKYGTSIPRAQGGTNMPSWYQNNPTGFQTNYQQPSYTPQSAPQVGSQMNNNLVSLTDDEVVNKNGMYNGYSDANGPNGNKRVKSPMSGQQQNDLADNVLSKAGLLGEGIQIGINNNKAKDDARQKFEVSSVLEKAQNSFAQNVPENRFVMPTDNIFTNNQLGSGNGTGTNVLSKNGSSIKKMYNGGNTQPQGWENYGGEVGATVGDAIAPGVGGLIGREAGKDLGLVANALDPVVKAANNFNNKRDSIEKRMVLNAGFNSFRGQNASYVKNGGNIASYENGGYMNPEYNPQLITMFGDHNSDDFADYAKQYRTGGHLKSYTPPSERAMEIYKDGGEIKSYGLGGELETHWGGGAETMSHNPYLPGTGETVMFRGKSHEEYSPNGETGIGVTYGGNPVEVERGEPMVELEDGGNVDPQTGEAQKSGVVFGNLKIPNQYIDLLGDPNAKNKKFKNYVADLSKTEDKQNKLIEKTTNNLNDFTPITSFDKLKMSSLEANMKGANMKLKSIADKKINAAHLQNSINETAEEYGLVADDLARGKYKIDKEAMKTREAKFGMDIPKAQNGLYKKKGVQPGMIDYNELGSTNIPYFANKETYEKSWLPKMSKALDNSETANQVLTGLENYNGQDAEDVKKALSKLPSKSAKLAKMYELASDYKPGPFHNVLNNLIDKTTPASTPPLSTTGETTTTSPIKTTTVETTKAKFPWEMYANQALQYLRPTNQEGLDPNQTYAEMLSLANSHVDPIVYQQMHSELGTPYDISRQAAKNDLIAQTRGAQRQVGYNPAAQANIAAQAYNPMQQLNEADFIDNQRERDRKFSGNRDKLNQAALTNIGFNKDYFDKKTQAYANTKAETLAALSSISDKYAKNKLENRTLATYENLYNYRFDKNGRAQNWNGLAQLDWSGRGGNSKQDLPEGWEYETVIKPKKKEANSKNGSIVKSYKNI